VKRCPSNDRLLENKTERQTVSSTRWEQEPGALPVKRSEALPNQRSAPTYLKDVLDRVSTHPQSRIGELMPDRW